MNTVVIYKSKTGFVKKYAEWIAKAVSADIFEASQIPVSKMVEYDTIVYGGGLYAVGINGVKLITGNLDKLKDKKIAVFASGLTPPREEDLTKVKNMNFTEEQQKYIKFFYLRGGFDRKKLGVFDKLLMWMLVKKVKSNKEQKPDERGMLAAYDNPVDFTREKNIDQLVDYIKY